MPQLCRKQERASKARHAMTELQEETKRMVITELNQQQVIKTKHKRAQRSTAQRTASKQQAGSTTHSNQAVHELLEQRQLRNQALHNLAEGLEDGVVVDRCQVEQRSDGQLGFLQLL